MAEIILIVLSVTIMGRYRKAGEKGGGKYVLGIWLTWLGTIFIGAMVASSSRSPVGMYVVILIGYVICFIVAANGMRSGRQYQENVEAARRREEEKRQEQRMEKEVQARVDAAVAAALAKQQQAVPQAAPETPYVPAHAAPAAQAVPETPYAPPAQPIAPSYTAPVAQPVAIPKTGGTFYVFAAQGPAFGSGFTGDMAMEKAEKLKADYAPAGDMNLVLIRPGEWPASISSSSSSGIISASFSIDDHRSEIERYLLRVGVPSEKIQQGLKLSKEHSLQLMNPMSGLFVMGIPIA